MHEVRFIELEDGWRYDVDDDSWPLMFRYGYGWDEADVYVSYRQARETVNLINMKKNQLEFEFEN